MRSISLERLLEDERYVEFYGTPEGFLDIFRAAEGILQSPSNSFRQRNQLKKLVCDLKRIASRSAKAHTLLALMFERLGDTESMYKHMALGICLSPRLISGRMELLRRVSGEEDRDVLTGILFAISDLADEDIPGEDELSAKLDQYLDGWRP